LLSAPLSSHSQAQVLVKVADFGLSARLSNGPIKQPCGTWAYFAPEVFAAARPGYAAPADAWALGVITYIVLCGFHPFDPTSSASHSRILNDISQGSFDFEDAAWTLVSSDAKNFISGLLTAEPAKRTTAAQALDHAWMLASSTGAAEPITNHIAEDILRYRMAMKAKLKASFVVAKASVRMFQVGPKARRVSTDVVSVSPMLVDKMASSAIDEGSRNDNDNMRTSDSNIGAALHLLRPTAALVEGALSSSGKLTSTRTAIKH
jgi:serine/threonine protein kinase